MPTRQPMVFGGQVAAQALVAASRTVEPPYAVHSLHSYFLQPGDPTVADDLRRREPARRPVVRHPPGDRAAARAADLRADASNFHVAEPGFEHQESMPDVPGPDHESVRPVSREIQEELHADQWNVADIRFVGSSAGALTTTRHPGRQQVWLRVSSALPDDQFWTRAAFTYLSDMTLVGAAMGTARG